MASGKLGSLRISHCSAACDKQTKAVRVRTCIPFASRLGRFACCEGGSPVPSHCDSVSTAAMSATHQDANHEHFLHFLPSLGAHWRRNYTRHAVLRIHLQSLLSLGLSPPCCHSAAHDIVCLLQRIPTNRSYRSHMKWRHVGTFAAARSSRFVRFWVYDGPCLVTVTADRWQSPCL